MVGSFRSGSFARRERRAPLLRAFCVAGTAWTVFSAAAQTGIYREMYTGITGGSIANLTNNAAFPNSPTSSNVLSNFETSANAADNYGQRLRALITAPATGQYIFWIASDDYSTLYLSSDESAFNKTAIAWVTSATSSRQWTKQASQQSTNIYLVAGQRYYIEALHKEGTGSDNLAVRWRIPGGADEGPIPGSRMVPYGQPAGGAPVLTVQPTNLIVLENTPAVFRVGVTNRDAVEYQWQRNGTNLSGARGATYTLASAKLTDHGAAFRCVISNALGVVTSAVAALSVQADTNPPVLYGAANVSSNQVLVLFSEPVAAGATNAANYELAGATISKAVFGASARQVVLTTTPLERGQVYTLTVNNVRDVAAGANLLPADSRASFTAALKGVYREIYADVAGNTVADLTDSPNFPGSPAAAELLAGSLETPKNYGENYGQRLRATVVPPLTGMYTFWIAADETASLYLGTNETPASARLIASVTAAMPARYWDGQASQKSASIPLVAGQPYYLEVLMKEGVTDDTLAVRWQWPDGTIEEPIPAAYLSPYGMPGPLISEPPTNTVAVEGGPVSFRVGVVNVDPLTYQWRRNGTNVPGATNAVFALPLLERADDQDTFQCVVGNPVGVVTSAVATLTVLPDVTPPELLNALNEGPTNVVVFYSEPVEAASATSAANYTLSDAVVLGAALRADGRSVTLTTSPLTFGYYYTLTVGNVRDRALAPNGLGGNVARTFRAFEFFPQDIGGANTPSAFALAGNGADVMAAGYDIGGTNDQFNFTYQTRTGDFDVKVRIQRLDPTELWARAGLMARENLTAGSRQASVLATPSLAGVAFQFRSTANGVATNSGAFPVNYPQTWLRLRRAGTQFTGYAGYDGHTWSQLGSVTMTLPATIYLGIASASRSLGQAATVEWRDFGEAGDGVVAPVTTTAEPLGPSSRRTGLVISEIMYHPPARADGRKLEFIELFNSNPVWEDLSGYRLSGDVDYTFPAGTVLAGGGFLVVAREPEDVRSVYGITNVLGPLAGGKNLPNGSGTMRLRNQSDAILLEVSYDNRPPWPLAADGAGHSLVLARPSWGEGNPKAWGQSSVIGGSPGRADFLSFEAGRNVVINEILARPEAPELDWVELYNHGTAPVDLSGWWLSDNPETNKFRIPDGTVIPPAGFVCFTEGEMGFGLDAGGETLFLVNSNRTRVVDAVRYEGQALGVSSGRSPDGAAGWRALAAKSPGAPNSRAQPPAVVINEIMYHPVSENDDDEYLELYNPAAAPLDVSGWRFTDGIDFTMPPATVIPPGGYLVVARNAARLLTNYPGLNAANTVGDFAGSLRNSGERIALARPELVVSTNLGGLPRTNVLEVLAAEVTYGTGGRWGQWSDGGGSSLELMEPRADPAFAANWADSDDTAKGVWTTVTATGLLDNSLGASSNFNSLQIYLQDAGECLVDDVFVSIAGGPNLVSNANFTADAAGWFFQGNHSRTTWEPGGSLHIRASGRGDTGANRVRTTLLSTYSNNVTGSITAKVKWLRGKPEILFRLRGNQLEAPGVLLTPPNLGTPGARNSRYAANAAPAIGEVNHSPVLPAAGQAVVVTARADDPDGVVALQLAWRLDPNETPNFQPMNDAGVLGDAVAGDGVFSATLPGQTNGALVAFYVQATDGFSPPATARFPHDAPARECLVRFGDAQPNPAFGTYRFWLTQTNFNRWVNREKLSNEPIEGTFVYGNFRAIYHAGNRYAGSPYHSPNFNSPIGNNCDYYVTLPGDDAFLAATEFTLQMPGNGGGDDTCQREQVTYWMANRLNIPFLHRRQVNVFINGTLRGRIFDDTQQPNGDFERQWNPQGADGGDLYKVMNWFEFEDAAAAFSSAGATLTPVTTAGGVKKLARYRQNFGKRAVAGSVSNYTNLFHLVDLLATTATGDAYAQQVFPQVDVWEWARVFAVERIVGNTDVYGNGGGQNLYIYKPLGAPWQAQIWDIDFALSSQQPNYTLFNFSDAPIIKLFGHPEVLRHYWQALEDAATGPLSNAEPLIDRRYAAYQACGINANSPATMKAWLASRRAYVLNQLATVRAPLAITTAGGRDFTSTNTLVVLSGTAPISARALAVNGVVYPATWSTITNWTLRLPLTGQTNLVVVEGLDAQGQLLSNAVASQTIYFNGPVSRPEDSLLISEIMYQPAVSNASYVEIFNRSTNTTFDLSGCRLKGVDFDFPIGTSLGPQSALVVVKSAAAFQAAYPSYAGAAIAGEFAGHLDADGETLALVKREGANEIVLNQVRYEAAAPWPQGAATPGGGLALQVTDLNQGNARVFNWSDAASWKCVSFSRSNYYTVTRTNLEFQVRSAGEIYVDDLRVEEGAAFGAGTNLVVNGDFEAPLAEGWVLGTNVTASHASPGERHTGLASLRLIASARANTVRADLSQPLTLKDLTPYTVTFWYLPSDTLTNLDFSITSFVRTNLVVLRSSLAASPGSLNPAGQALPVAPPVWLNELQAENLAGPRDNFGERDPWVELHNSGTNAVSLEGWCLSDTYSHLARWVFPPDTVIAPGEFKVIWLDGQPEQSDGASLHAGFRLPPGRGSLALSMPVYGAPAVVDYLNYALAPNSSVGALPDGQPLVRETFHFATPGAGNRFSPAPVAINEWMASNTRTLVNPATGRYDDWIELFNTGSAAADLSGYYLTDDLGNPRQWRIPAGTIVPPRGFLLVWADNGAVPAGPEDPALHANFQLSRNGDAIGLFSPEGVLVDSVRFGEQLADRSQGRYPDGNVDGVAAQAVPTPGAGNRPDWPPPSLAAVPDRVIHAGTWLTVTNLVTHPELPAGAFTFSLSNAPSGVAINPTNGVLTWTPTDDQANAAHLIVVVVTGDGWPGLSAVTSFTVQVRARPQVRVAARPGELLTLTWEALPDRAYRLQSAADLNGEWVDLPEVGVISGDTVTRAIPVDADRQRFFRVVVVE